MNFSNYLQSPYVKYQNFIEETISSYELPSNFYKKEQIGTSCYNNPIFSYQLGSGDFCILMTAGVHGREAINSFALLAILNHYCAHLTCNADWFSTHRILFIPMVNPDGYFRSLTEVTFKNNGNDIDLNRNFPCKLWKKKWKEDMPASEVETKMLIQQFHLHNPHLYFDIHSRGEGIYYYRNTMPSSYNETQEKIANVLSSITGYELYPPELEINPNDSGGNTVQYFAETFKKPAFTIETVPDNATFPISNAYLPDVFNQLVSIPFLF